MVGFIPHLFVAWLRTGLAADLCWGVPGHDAPGDFRKSQPPPQTAKMKFFRDCLWIIAALPSMFPAGFRINVVTSDHRVVGSSPDGCKSSSRADLQASEATQKSVTERKTYHSLTTFEVYPLPAGKSGTRGEGLASPPSLLIHSASNNGVANP